MKKNPKISVAKIRKLIVFEGQLQTKVGIINSKFVDWYMLNHLLESESE